MGDYLLFNHSLCYSYALYKLPCPNTLEQFNDQFCGSTHISHTVTQAIRYPLVESYQRR